MRSSSLLASLAVWLCLAQTMAGDTIRAGALELRLDESRARAVARCLREAGDFEAGTVEVLVTEGPQKLSLAQDKSVNIRNKLNTVRAHVRWQVTVENRSKASRSLEVRCQFGVKFKAPVKTWDGYKEGARPGENQLRNNVANTFPMTCAWAGHDGVAVALKPDTLCSWLEHRYEAETPQSGRLSEAVRVVVEPGGRETVEFELYAFPADYGHLDALQRYYDEFPQWFCAPDDVDPRVSGGGATYQAWTANSPEMCRRFYGDWEWCYAAFRRTGDWYGREELWNYQPARPMSKDRLLPREEFLRARVARFERGKRCNAAMLFYLPSNIWCEIQLANEHYKDAIVLRTPDKTGGARPIEFHKPWVTGHDDEMVVFPWATSFAEACKRDMRQLAAELNIAGFAFDTANGGTAYRGEGAAKCPGRAWDERGVFADIGVAVAQMVDFVHSLRTRDGRRCALVSNPTGGSTYAICFRSDSAMHEYAPYRQVDEQRALRYMLGHKTLVWWDDYAAAPLLRWEEMTPAEIRQAYLGLADYVLLRSLYMGGIPTPRLVLGVPKLARALPMIHEIVRAGWQPAPAFKPVGDRACDTGLWAARYGDGLGTFLTLGNATLTNFAGEIEVEHRYLGSFNCLFAPYGNGSLVQTLSGGTTRLPAKLAPREALAMKAVLALPADWSGRANVEQTEDRSRIELVASKCRSGTARVRLPNDCRLASLVVNGQRTAFSEERGAARFKLPSSERIVIEAAFESRWLSSARQAILDFPFENASIELPDAPAQQEQDAAEALREYFRFFATQTMPRRPPFALKACKSGDVGSQHGLIRFRPERACVNDGNLIVNPAPAAMHALLRLLDRKYFIAGRFPTSGESDDEKALIKKSGLGGGLLE
ncbi:MAG: hypothetical protein WC740_05135 [Verrucomicrobiia bacterium]